jgi:hypothetical protein
MKYFILNFSRHGYGSKSDNYVLTVVTTKLRKIKLLKCKVNALKLNFILQ